MKLQIFLILFIVLIVGTGIFFIMKNPNQTGNAIIDDENNNQNNENINTNTEDINSNTISGSSGSSSSGSGGSGGGRGGSSSDGTTSTPEIPSDANCILKQISYGIKNFKQEREDNLIICSLDLYNLDETTTGEFEIEFSLDNSELEEIYVKKTIEALSNQTFKAEFETYEDVTCSYQTLIIPKKEVCN
ncbi:MAG: hypothetical protein WC438_03675 [Candidatus Pacearchaeota archaeon]